ncbi:MAG TPA: nuclear transport factor 2 family protein [Acidimicrobiales bacterium]|nr:nuclear transport factor 2 family protein [Acidimicrobiales bacterium]
MHPSSHEQQIRNLLYRYMEATDNGDFDTRAQLFEHAVVYFPEPIGAISGAAVAESFRSRQRLYDGIPRTAHLCLNVIIELDEAATSAAVRSRYLVMQETPDLPLQPIIAGRYHDRFERVDDTWRFAERRFIIDLVGEMSAHQNAGVPAATVLRETQNAN